MFRRDKMGYCRRTVILSFSHFRRTQKKQVKTAIWQIMAQNIAWHIAC